MNNTYTIYQLKQNPETAGLCFLSYDRIRQHSRSPIFENYEEVYSGKLPAIEDTDVLLENLYERFNIASPSDFVGHSLSVSDVVVLNRDSREEAFYVDSVGFRPIPDFLHSEPLKQVLLVRPDELPIMMETPLRLSDLQRFVDGTFEAVYPFEDPVALIVDDTGKLTGKPLNRSLSDEYGQIYDSLAGDFLVVGLDGENFTTLTPELLTKYEQRFHTPELFLHSPQGIVVMPYEAGPAFGLYRLNNNINLHLELGSSGWRFTVHDKNLNVMERGRIDAEGQTIREAVHEISSRQGLDDSFCIRMDHHILDNLAEKERTPALRQEQER